jgi:uncharacterized protein
MAQAAPPFTHAITSIEQLRDIIPAPKPDAYSILKQQTALDDHCRAVIAASPFMLLATAGADGRCDVSPRGDGPGFVHVIDDHTIAIPDRPGNRRVDSLENIIENPHAGLIFLVPGMDETLRVNGPATITQDPDLLARMPAGGKIPTLAIVVAAEEVYFQCARALKRARLWQHEHWIDRAALPTFGRILKDQIKPADLTAEELDAYLEESNRRLYE